MLIAQISLSISACSRVHWLPCGLVGERSGILIGEQVASRSGYKVPLSMRYARRMLRLTKRLALSLLAGGIASVAAFQVTFGLAMLQLKIFDPHADGQAGIGPFFGALFVALALAILTFALIFRRSQTWR